MNRHWTEPNLRKWKVTEKAFWKKSLLGEKEAIEIVLPAIAFNALSKALLHNFAMGEKKVVVKMS